jgi:hypothetical protein
MGVVAIALSSLDKRIFGIDDEGGRELLAE